MQAQFHRPAFGNRHPAAVLVIAGAHVAVGYLLVTSLSRHVIERPPPPVEARVVEEPQRPPPPPPPPLAMPVPLAPPPPLYMPPPEVRIERPPPPPPRRVIRRAPPAPPPPPVIVPAAPAPAAPVAVAPPAPVPAPPPPAPPPPAPPPPPPRLATPARISLAGCTKPAYPREALRAGATGTTRIEFAVDARGRVIDATLAKASGSSAAHRRMDRAAIAALGRCAFQPGTDSNGRPIGASAVVEYVWRLD